MDETFRAVGQLLIQALPTFFVVLLLYFLLKQIFFAPLQRVLDQRREATEGARAHATAALERARAKAAAYEEQLRVARGEIFREQDEQRRVWRDQQASQIAEARKNAEVSVAAAKSDLQAQAESAKQSLRTETPVLADRITAAILEGRTV